MPVFDLGASKICLRVFRILILFLGILLFMVVWFEFPLQQETFRMNLEMQKQIDGLGDMKQAPQNMKHMHKIPHSEKLKFQGFQGMKLVHIDLKGAPPKIDYLLQLLVAFKDMGANGILIEYEDMFPYHGLIRILSSQNAYSYSDIEMLLSTANELKLEVIPLIQTLGHFEFVLKHEQFRFLRESPLYPNMPCPLHKKTQEVVLKMVHQVLRLHPNISRIHLGGDEVFNLKDCEKCKQSGHTKEHLFTHHMLPILQHVRDATNYRVKPIIWDDMLRKWSVFDMQRFSGLTDLMVWGYVPNLDSYSQFPEDMWEKYGKAFDKIWLASSYKGALAANNNLVPILMHLQNHESWLRVSKKVKNKIAGIALTGWARYDHFAALCELLPASLPTLALSLSVLKEGSYKLRGKNAVETTLGFKNGLMIEKDLFGSWDTSIPNFPGGNVFALVAELENHVSWYESAKTRLDSWGNERQVEENRISMFQINGAAGTLQQLLPSLEAFRRKCETVLKQYFFDDTVNEWIRDKVDSYIILTRQLKERLKEISIRLKMKIEL